VYSNSTNSSSNDSSSNNSCGNSSSGSNSSEILCEAGAKFLYVLIEYPFKMNGEFCRFYL
jgi:hypothetical protein